MKSAGLCLVLGLLLSACAPGQTGALVDAVFPTTTSKGTPGLGSTLAASYNPTNPTWIYGQFFLDPAARTQACRDGYASASAGAAQVVTGEATYSSTEGAVTFRSAYRNIAEVCRALAARGSALPDTVPPQGVNVSAAYKTNIDTPILLLAFYDAAGRETARIPVLDAGHRVFGTPVQGYAIARGQNLPEASFTLGQKTAIAGASSFKILADLGRGIESFEIMQDRLY